MTADFQGYRTDENKLESLIQRALHREDVSNAIDDGVTTAQEITADVKTRSSDIWNSGLNEIGLASEAFTYMKAAKSAAEPSLKKLLDEEQRRLPRRIGILQFLSAYILHGATFLFGLVIVWIVFLKGWSDSYHWLLIWTNGLKVAGLVLFVGLGAFALKRTLGRTAKSLVDEVMEERRRRTVSNSKQILSEHRIPELEQQFYQLLQNADDAVVEKGILPAIRSFVNERIEPWREAPFAVILPDIPVPGLGEVFDPSFEVPTDAKAEVLQLFDAMPGGSVAVAGPRGAGKTTLLWTICNGSVKQVKSKDVLTIMSSAPVRYDAREFILHLFSSVCSQVLRLNNESDEVAPWRTIKQRRQPARFRRAMFYVLLPGLGRIGFFLILAGAIALSLSLFIAMTKIERSNQPAPAVTTGNNNLEPTPNPTPTPLAISRTSLFEMFELKPGPFLWYGIWLLVVGTLVRYTTRHLYRFMHEYVETAGADESDGITEPGKSSKFDPKTALKAEARRWREEIRFQQSFSSGWSGSLKLPIGLEGGVTEAVSLAQMQLSLPEIVEGFRHFITLASTNYQVVIAIDELDKIESDEKAQLFLNEIKAIFGLERCFYLVSVSQSALSSFERRGLPFRDAFDSAFDDMVHVDYLSLEAAKRLLLSRVIGLPVSFLTFCYCFSGGLARDLLRACRALFQHAAKVERRELSVLVQSLAAADLRAKTRATIASAVNLDPGPHLSLLLERLRLLEHSLSRSGLVDCVERFLSDEVNLGLATSEASIKDVQQTLNQKMQTLYLDLTIYMYYILTLVQVFNAYSAPIDWKQSSDSAIFDEIASVRQYLSSNTMSARSAISHVRRSCNLPLLPVGGFGASMDISKN